MVAATYYVSNGMALTENSCILQAVEVKRCVDKISHHQPLMILQVREAEYRVPQSDIVKDTQVCCVSQVVLTSQ